jgi:hypothetical protein
MPFRLFFRPFPSSLQTALHTQVSELAYRFRIDLTFIRFKSLHHSKINAFAAMSMIKTGYKTEKRRQDHYRSIRSKIPQEAHNTLLQIHVFTSWTLTAKLGTWAQLQDYHRSDNKTSYLRIFSSRGKRKVLVYYCLTLPRLKTWDSCFLD